VTPAPCGWLHMEVLERDKMEWMTDVPLHPQPSEVGGWCLPCSRCVAELCLQQGGWAELANERCSTRWVGLTVQGSQQGRWAELNYI